MISFLRFIVKTVIYERKEEINKNIINLQKDIGVISEKIKQKFLMSTIA